MLQTKLIKAETIFQNLVVEGPVYIYDDCNGINLDTLLSNVVYKSDAKIILSSFKSFDFVDMANIVLTSNLLNDIKINRYLTTDTDQETQIDKIFGNIFVKNLFIDGLFDFINITELDINAIKLFGEQYTGAELIFNNIIDGGLNINNIEILKTCNGHQLDDFVLIDKELHLDGTVIVDNVQVDDLIVEGEVKGKMVNGINMDEFDSIRISRTKKQIITKPCHVKTAIIQDLNAQSINRYNTKLLQQQCNNIRNVRKHLSSDNVRLENLIINGSVSVAEVNGHNFDSIVDNAIWLNKLNIINGKILFEIRPIFQKDLIVDHLNDVAFSNFITNLLLRNTTDFTFTGVKSFTEPIHIIGDISANKINEINTKNILAKCCENFQNTIKGKLTIDGNINVETISLAQNINGMVFDEIVNLYAFDVKNQCHVLKKNVYFNLPLKIENFQLRGSLNNVLNMEQFINNIIYKYQSGFIHGLKSFKSNVYFKSDLFVERHNEINVLEFFQDILLIDGSANNKVIKNVAFEEIITAPTIKIGNIMAKSIMGCNIEEWMRNALRTDLPITITETLLFPRGTFRAANINLVYLNGQSLSDVFTLHTEQKFAGIFRFSDVYSYSRTKVSGNVNGVDLRTERQNTVMVKFD